MFISLTLLCVYLSGCSLSKQEIVWYISSPENYGVNREELEEYQEINAKCFELFNKRISDMDIPAKVVFKYVSNRYEVSPEDFENNSFMKNDYLFQTTFIENLVNKDPEADIVSFSPMEFEKFAGLDQYLLEDKNSKVLESLPNAIWDINRINGKTYQIPKGNASLTEITYIFNKSFIEKHNIDLEANNIENMTPVEVVNFLLPYFENERLLDNKYYLTSASDLNYKCYFQDRYIPVVQNSKDINIAIDTKENKVVNMLDTYEMQNMFNLYQWIYEEDIDAHIERERLNGEPVFEITDIPTIKELSVDEDSYWKSISLGNRTVSRSIGNGVLKSSDNKDLAVQVLAASMYDKALSNIMIHGVPDIDYEVKDNKVIYKTNKMISSMGSFSSIGNNMIALPNELEVEEKEEITKKLFLEAQICHLKNFMPVFSTELSEKMSDVIQEYNNIQGIIGFETVPDVEKFINDEKDKLKSAGSEEIIIELQKQLDDWSK